MLSQSPSKVRERRAVSSPTDSIETPLRQITFESPSKARPRHRALTQQPIVSKPRLNGNLLLRSSSGFISKKVDYKKVMCVIKGKHFLVYETLEYCMHSVLCSDVVAVVIDDLDEHLFNLTLHSSSGTSSLHFKGESSENLKLWTSTLENWIEFWRSKASNTSLVESLLFRLDALEGAAKATSPSNTPAAISSSSVNASPHTPVAISRGEADSEDRASSSSRIIVNADVGVKDLDESAMDALTLTEAVRTLIRVLDETPVTSEISATVRRLCEYYTAEVKRAQERERRERRRAQQCERCAVWCEEFQNYTCHSKLAFEAMERRAAQLLHQLDTTSLELSDVDSERKALRSSLSNLKALFGAENEVHQALETKLVKITEERDRLCESIVEVKQKFAERSFLTEQEVIAERKRRKNLESMVKEFVRDVTDRCSCDAEEFVFERGAKILKELEKPSISTIFIQRERDTAPSSSYPASEEEV